MRTPEQIRNLRWVLYMQIGAPALFLSEEQIDAFANALQRQVDSTKYEWVIKVKLVENSSEAYEDIRPEPVRPVATLEQLHKLVSEVMLRHPVQLLEVWAKVNGADDNTAIVFKNPR